MIYSWAKGTDGNGASIRTVIFDYRKAFDLIDHNILITKICKLDLPNSIINWIIDFLTNRAQRIKLADEWGTVPSGVPQGTKLESWLFLVLIACLQAVVCIRARVQSPANPVAILDELVKDLGRATKRGRGGKKPPARKPMISHHPPQRTA